MTHRDERALWNPTSNDSSWTSAPSGIQRPMTHRDERGIWSALSFVVILSLRKPRLGETPMVQWGQISGIPRAEVVGRPDGSAWLSTSNDLPADIPKAVQQHRTPKRKRPRMILSNSSTGPNYNRPQRNGAPDHVPRGYQVSTLNFQRLTRRHSESAGALRQSGPDRTPKRCRAGVECVLIRVSMPR
jgi:hypothetical protein